MKHVTAVLSLALLSATTAFAQTAQHDHTAMTQAAAEQASMDHDAMFADTMTKHHQDGIRMSQMAVEKAQSPELRAMAQKMIDEQRRDITEMQSVRENAPATSKAMMQKMPGMMPESEMMRDMARLEAASGREFDRVFTEVMPKHHQGAITMSNHELDRGDNDAMKVIARRIADTQAREREQLMAMHQDLHGNTPATMASSAEERRRMSKD